MIFKRLRLENFRQYAGQQEIRFACDGQRTVTVVHGANGSGKTTLLNAFTWLLYEEFSPDFQDSDRLETELSFVQLPPGKDLVTSVLLEFEDDGREYRAERKAFVKKDEHGNRIPHESTKLTLYYTDESGTLREPGNPQNFLERLLPKQLLPFFFFNGERIERLASADAYTEVEGGVRVLLDIELFDRAINHLEGDLSRRLRTEIAEHSGDEGKRTKEERDRLEDQLEDRRERLEQLERNQAALLKERDTIDLRLATMPGLARLQERRSGIEREISSTKSLLQECVRQVAHTVSRHGYLIIAPDVLVESQGILDAAHERGELPVRIKRQFVDELLATRQCICGRPLEPDSTAYLEVMSWRNRAGSEELEQHVAVTRAELMPLQTRRQAAIERLDHLQAERDRLRSRIRELEEERDEISSEIERSEGGDDPLKLEARRRQIEDLLLQVKVDLHEAKKEQQALEDSIRALDLRLKEITKADEAGKLADRRLSAVTNVCAVLRQIRELRHQNLRRDLSSRLSRVWDGIAIKDYQAELDEQYHLRLTKRIGDEVAPVRGASTGEKQVLSLAFIGSLVEKARATFQSRRDRQDLFQGGLYALVMDSPFGNLEAEYRRDVARWMPSLAPQLILFVSETQWRNEVEEELIPRIGREYVLRCETPKNRTRPIRLRNRDYEYVIESADGIERTTLMEVGQ